MSWREYVIRFLPKLEPTPSPQVPSQRSEAEERMIRREFEAMIRKAKELDVFVELKRAEHNHD